MTSTGSQDRRRDRRVGGYSLRLSLGVAFGLIVLVTCGLLGTLTWRQARGFVREDIRTRLGDLAGAAALLVNVEEHERIREPGDEGSREYQDLVARLRALRASSTDVRFIYTMRPTESGGFVFILDAEEDSAAHSHVGDPYEAATPLMRGMFGERTGVRVEEEFGSDEWGTWLSGYAPLVDSGGRTVALVGLDISASRVLDYEDRLLALITGVSVAIGALGLLLGTLLARRISRPLVVLEQEMMRIQRFDLEGDVPVRSRISEVNEMKIALENMKQGLRSFRRYVPADLVAELIQMRREAVIGAERRTLTLWFCDIAGFTSVAEALSPEELASRLGVYFEGMTRIILEEGGTVDKYIGDSIMAFWGAPREAADHAERACRAALRCRDFVQALSAEWRSKGIPAFDTRFGINTGEVNVGNFGYAERLNYTAMGDSVNLASRLEGLNAAYGTRILVSAATRSLLGEAFVTRRIDRVAVKGKSRGVEVVELVSEGEDAAGTREFTRLYESGLDLYAARDWAGAAVAFRAALAARPEDGPSRVMVARCALYSSEPPPEDWDGTWVMTGK